MVLLAKFIRMRTALSAATASHPCVEHATEGINQYQEQSFAKIMNLHAHALRMGFEQR